MDPIYCPVCKKQISAADATCPHCGAKTTTTERKQDAEAEAKKAAYLGAEAIRVANEEKARLQAEDEEARRETVYRYATGKGVCPNCKSPNVVEYVFTEGGSDAGKSMACCLGCAFNPLAWLLIPFLSKKKAKGLQCQYCSNRWRL
jgi:DNA-directed RNA polymerase subunit RPC12/RpoP